METKVMVEPVAVDAATAAVASPVGDPHDNGTVAGTRGPEARMPTIEKLHTLAHVVADALDRGDDRRAWAITQAVEQTAGLADASLPPSRPVIGRRFARAHQRLLAAAKHGRRPAADEAHALDEPEPHQGAPRRLATSRESTHRAVGAPDVQPQ